MVTNLIRAFRNGHYEEASAVIQGQLTEFYAERVRDDPTARAEFKRFGKLFATAKKINDPTPLLGQLFHVVSLHRVFERWSQVVVCHECNRLTDQNTGGVRAEGRSYVCMDCATRYIHSPLMGFHIPRNDMVPVITGPNQSSPVTMRYLRLNDMVVEFRGQRYSRAYYETIQDSLRGLPQPYPEGGNPFNPKDVPIGEYHSSKRYVERLPSPVFDKIKPSLLIGIELEIELSQDSRWMKAKMEIGAWRIKCAQALKGLLNGPNGEEHYALIESDGSISYGFEVVTGWTGLDTHERILQVMKSKAFDDLVKKYGMKSHDTTTCGLHVTIDRAGMSLLHMGKFQVFLNAPTNTMFLDKICRRSAQRYAKKKHDKFATAACALPGRLANYDADRYEIANTSGNPFAIEFRGPRGTLKFESIMASMEFIRLVWLFTKDASIQDLNELCFTDFVWRREHAFESKYLRPYMVERGVAAEDHMEIPTTRRLSIQESLADASTMGFIVNKQDI